jgi:hypothetical protein
MNTVTKKKLTVMLDAEVYEALQEKVGERGIGVFLSNLARPYVVKSSLDDGYRAMAMDNEREADADAWIQSDLEVSDTEKNVWQF